MLEDQNPIGSAPILSNQPCYRIIFHPEPGVPKNAYIAKTWASSDTACPSSASVRKASCSQQWAGAGEDQG